MAPRPAFKLRGEQIDGSFVLGEFTYLLEAKWQNAKSDLAGLRSFQAKVEERPDWTLGLFVSFSGFTTEALSEFAARRTVLVEGFDLHEILERRLSLPRVIDFKRRRMSEMRRSFVSVREFTT